MWKKACFTMGNTRDLGTTSSHSCASCMRGPPWSSSPAPSLIHTVSFALTKPNYRHFISQPASIQCPSHSSSLTNFSLTIRTHSLQSPQCSAYSLTSQISLLAPQLLYTVGPGMALPTLWGTRTKLSKVQTGPHSSSYPQHLAQHLAFKTY